MTEIDDLVEFLKLRLTLVGAVAVTVAIGTIGLIDLMRTMTVNSFPMYVHFTVGALVFPLSVFVLQYRGRPEPEAVKFGSFFGTSALVLFLLFSEGGGRIANGILELGAPTLFYVVSVSLIAATLIVSWVERTHLRPPQTAATRTVRRDRK